MASKPCQMMSNKPSAMTSRECQTTIVIVDQNHKEAIVLQETIVHKTSVNRGIIVLRERDHKENALKEATDHKERDLRETIVHKENVLRETIDLKATDLREAIDHKVTDLKANVLNTPTTSQTLETRIQEMPNKASKMETNNNV